MNTKNISLTILLILINSFAFGSTSSIPTPEVKSDVGKPPLSLPDKESKIIGKWKLTLPNTACTEIYNFRADGTTSVNSGEEYGESVYRISSFPTAKGFYILNDKVTKTNGGKSCSGSTIPIGHEVTMYISFHPSGNMFIICESESFDACMGPLERIKEQENTPNKAIEPGRD
jgi:hypothetical protein